MDSFTVHTLTPQSTITVIKSQSIRWAGDAACMGERVHTYLMETPKGRYLIGDRRRWEGSTKIDGRETV
jgi:hypothetical protein